VFLLRNKLSKSHIATRGMTGLSSHCQPGGTKYFVSACLSSSAFDVALIIPKIDVYSAATVLVAARMDPLRDYDSDNSIEESWRHCLEILNGQAQISKSALACVTALEFLDRHMLAEQGQRDATQQQNFQVQGYNTGPQQPVHGTLPNVSAHDVGSDSMNTTAANSGDLFYSMGTPDLAWLHTVPMDLQNFEMDDIFGTAFL
jgi:hypothetical protein